MNLHYWIECDMHIKHMCEKRGGIPIPNEYAYLLNDKLRPAIDDEYKCYIQLDGEQYEKYIFGFNSKETYDEIIKKNDERILSYLQKTEKPIYEATTSYDDIDKAIRVINILYDERCEVSGCFSEKIMDILNNNIETLDSYIKKNPSDLRSRNIQLAIENGRDIIDSSTLLTLHAF